MPKQLELGSDDVEINVNAKFAEDFDRVKRKQELQKLSSKYDNVASDTDTDEDDDARFITEPLERDFTDLISRLRSNDPSLKDPAVKFFSEGGVSPERKSGRVHDMKSEFHRGVAGEAADPDDAERHATRRQSRADRAARAAFMSVAEDAAGNAAAEFTVKKPDAAVEAKRDVTQVIQAFGKTDNADDAFLAQFFAKESWRQDTEPVYTWEMEAADNQDEAFYDDAEQWEREFEERKFHHEEAGGDKIQAFPRHESGLLRAQDTTRKEARERKAERKKDETTRADEELKRLKNLKRDEIRAFQRKIEEVAGLGKRRERTVNDGDGDRDGDEESKIAKLLNQAALEEDFDPETFDKQMAALFNDDYYNDVDDDELGVMAAEDSDGSDDDDGPSILVRREDEAQVEASKRSERRAARETAKRAAKELPAPLQGFDDELLYPTKAIAAALDESTGNVADDPEELQRQLDQKVDEYWKLHYSGTAGGIRTRFKYREVNPEHFGLTEEEILMLDDRSLNMIAPLTCYAAYNTRAQNTKDRYRAMHRRKNLRMLPADRKSRRYKNKTVVFDPDEIQEHEGREIARRVRERVGGAVDDLDAELAKEVRTETSDKKQVRPRDDQSGNGPRKRRGPRAERPQ